MILARDRYPEGIETFILKRSLKSLFMAGFYVCPGGGVDKRDGETEWHTLCEGVAGDDGDENFVFRIGGARELYEEAGVLLASYRSGGLVRTGDGAAGDRLRDYRALLQQRKITFRGIVEKENLLLRVGELHFFAHWITPVVRPIRFDTRFFICRCPPGQEATADGVETSAGLWLSPAEALKANAEGTIALSSPTLKTLEDMTPFGSVDEVIDSLHREEVPTILPVLADMGEEELVILPWDPDFARFESGDIPRPVDHGRPSEPGDITTRFILKDGRSLAYCKA